MSEKLIIPSKLADIQHEIFDLVEPVAVKKGFELPYSMYRKDNLTGGRFYFSDGIPYISGTNLINNMIPKGYGYEKWLMNKGAEAELQRDLAAEFGTIFHIDCVEILKNETGYNFNNTRDFLMESCKPQYQTYVDDWVPDYKKGIASWLQFLNDKVTGWIMIEGPMRSTSVNVAVTLDLVATIMHNRKEKPCIVDIKSLLGKDKKTYYEAHRAQLGIQKQVWNENFPKYQIEMLYNWSPKNFSGDTPTYDFVKQYGEKNEYDDPDMLKLMYNFAKKRGVIKPPKQVVDIVGEVENWKQFNFENHNLKVTV